MKTAASTLAMVLFLVGGASAQEAQLKNQKSVFSFSRDDAARPVLQLGSMRLSPDGNRLLYVRQERAADKPADYAGPWSGRLCRLVLRDIQSGKEDVVPGAAMTWDDPMALLVRENPFDREGKRLAVYASTDGNRDGILDGRTGNMSAGVVDVASGRMTKVGIEGPIVLPMFAGNGKDLLIVNWRKDESQGQVLVLSEPNAAPRVLSVSAVPLAVAPGSDLVAFLSMQKDTSASAMFVHDIKADKTIVSLTLHPKNTKLDDLPPLWTADGKHLYYYDLEPPAEAPPPMPPESPRVGMPSTKQFTRVWGLQQKGEVAVLNDLIPLAPGPGGTMVMTDRNGSKTVIHDPARGGLFSLDAGSRRPVWAGGGKILLASAKADADGRTEIVVADIVLPATPTTASAPAKDK